MSSTPNRNKTIEANSLLESNLLPDACPSDARVLIRHLGLQEYVPTWQAMRGFTQSRDGSSVDEIWFLTHPQVYTQGQAGKPEHILDASGIPVVQIDRGGQVTYHGPGQLVVYLLLDLKRQKMGIRDLVDTIETSIVLVLSQLGIDASPQKKAPGVYVNEAKIASLGLRIKRGCCYHGLSLNVDMDLAPFLDINPCGYEGLKVTQIADHFDSDKNHDELMDKVLRMMEEVLLSQLAYAEVEFKSTALIN